MTPEVRDFESSHTQNLLLDVEKMKRKKKRTRVAKFQ